MAASVSVIVLAGGSSRRFGSDKLAATLPDGRSVLDACLLCMPSAWPVVIVGPVRPVPEEVVERVRFTRERPAGGGPLAGIAAGLQHVDTEFLCVVAGDTPRAGELLPDLVAALTTSDADPHPPAAAVASDGEGQANPLLAAYRVKELTGALPDDPESRPARTLLTLPHVLHPAGDIIDVDRPEDLVRSVRPAPPT